MEVFLNAVFPVFLVFLIGYLLQKKIKLNIKTLSAVAVYVLIPCLIFESLINTEFKAEHLSLVIITIIIAIITIIIVTIFVKLNNYDKKTESALVLTSVFMNAGNYGSPIVLFTLGQEAFYFAISFYVIQTIMFNTLGLYYIARSKKNIIDGVKNTLKIPSIHAVFLALILKKFSLALPESIMSSVDLLAEGAIPIIMLLLGTQIANLKIGKVDWKKTTFVSITRLIVSPCIVILLTLIIPIESFYRNVLIIQASMPTAVNASLYSIEFNMLPDLVSITTIINTFLSILTVTFILNILI